MKKLKAKTKAIGSEIVDVGIRLKELRERVELTQKQVAETLRVREATISAWERGVSPVPVRRLRKLAKMYKTTTDYILNVEHGHKVIVLDDDLSDVEYEILLESTLAMMATIKKARGRR